MIVEDCGKFPRPITSSDAGVVHEIIKKGSAFGNNGDFNEFGMFWIYTRAPGDSFRELWGSNILQWDPKKYRLNYSGDFIQVHEKDHFLNKVQTIDPGNFRCVDPFGHRRTTIGKEGFLMPLNKEGYYNFQDNFPDCPKKLFTLEEVLEESDKGEKSPIWGSTMSMIRVADSNLIGESVTSLRFGCFYSHDPRKIDAVVINEESRQLVDRQIIYPLIDEESYKFLTQGSISVKYKVASAEELFGSIL